MSLLPTLVSFTGRVELPDTVEKYQKSTLNRAEAEKYLQELNSLMATEKIYTSPDITLSSIAERISISRHLLSMILNEVVKMNFYDFINSYRIEEIKLSLLDEDKRDSSILELAFDAGFNSKSTFNAVFKKQTGMTPSQFRKQMAIKNT